MTRRQNARLAAACTCIVVAAAATIVRAQDEARQIWDSYFAVSRPPATSKPATADAPRYKPSGAKPQVVAVGKPGSVFGVTIWRIESPRASDQARLLVQEPGAARRYTPHRLEAGELLREGDRVRLSVEAASSGYLYVVDQELRADQTLGPPYLIFPTRRTRNGDNHVRGGRLVDIPAQSDAVNVFTIRRKGPTDAGEELTFLLSPLPLTDFGVPADAEPLPAAVLASWTSRSTNTSQRYELQGGKGRAWTVAEQQAGAGDARLLTLADPAPQTVFFFPSAADHLVLATIRLQVASAAPAR